MQVGGAPLLRHLIAQEPWPRALVFVATRYAYDPLADKLRRAGQPGLVVSFVNAATEAHFRLIEKRQRRRVPREQIAGFEPTETASPAAATGGVKGKRPSKKDKLRAKAAGGESGADKVNGRR